MPKGSKVASMGKQSTGERMRRHREGARARRFVLEKYPHATCASEEIWNEEGWPCGFQWEVSTPVALGVAMRAGYRWFGPARTMWGAWVDAALALKAEGPPLVRDPSLAQQVALRELEEHAQPTTTIQLSTKLELIGLDQMREAWGLPPRPKPKGVDRNGLRYFPEVLETEADVVMRYTQDGQEREFRGRAMISHARPLARRLHLRACGLGRSIRNVTGLEVGHDAFRVVLR